MLIILQVNIILAEKKISLVYSGAYKKKISAETKLLKPNPRKKFNFSKFRKFIFLGYLVGRFKLKKEAAIGYFHCSREHKMFFKQ